MVVRGVGRAFGLAGAGLTLAGIGSARSAEEREFVYCDVAPFGQPDRKRRFADETLVREVFARAGNSLDAKVALEVMVDFGGRASFAYFGQVCEDRRECTGGALQQVRIDGR